MHYKNCLFLLKTAEEILNFVQTDLAPEDVMLLDAHDVIYLWIGNLSTKEEKRLSVQTATEYLRTGKYTTTDYHRNSIRT